MKPRRRPGNRNLDKILKIVASLLLWMSVVFALCIHLVHPPVFAATLVAFLAVELIRIHRENRPKYWNAFFALKENQITDEQWEEAERYAGQWPTCACGQLDAGIRRVTRAEWQECAFGSLANEGSPADEKLRALGYKFCGDICERDSESAYETFCQIQARAAELLAT